MKKLLCVLMFGMVFGQTELTTKSYTIEIIHSDVIDIVELTGYEFDYFIVQIVNVNPRTPYSGTYHKLRNTLVEDYYDHEVTAYEKDTHGIHYTSNLQSQQVFVNTNTLVYFGDWNATENIALTILITAEFPEEDTGYIEEGFDYCIDVGANLVAFPCRDAVPILDTLPSEIADNLTGIIGQGVATTNQNGNWVGSLSGLGGGNGYWFKSNVSACFNYNCAEN